MARTTPVPGGLLPETIEARIRAYESFGIHRTGWPADDQTSTWLRDELRAAGVNAELERFDFPRVEYRKARISWRGGAADGIPMYDCGFTEAGGLDGDLCADDADDVFGKIVIATSALTGDRSWTAADPSERYAAFSERGAIGLVVPSGDPDGAIAVRNAERIDRPLRMPVLQVAPRDVRGLVADLIVGVEGVLEVDGERLKSRATNVVATLPGSDPAARSVGVMTPKSGWFTCAAERGGGLAIWLALAEALAARGPLARSVQLVASSGHELKHWGLADYLKKRAAAGPGGAAGTWLHLGASIGAREGSPRVGASDDELERLAAESLGAEGVAGFETMPAGAPGGGEAREVHAQGARFVTFLGGHKYFHSPQDTTERAVDVESVANWGRAALTVLDGMLESQDAPRILGHEFGGGT